MPRSKLLKTIPIITLIILSLIFCFYNLSKPPLEIWDEYTNFNVIYDTIESKEPLKHNSWFNRLRLNQSSSGFNAPALNLSLNQNPFLEKPPLWYYLTIFSTKIFGINNFSIRFVSATSGFLLIMLITYLGWKMFSRKAGLIAGFSALATRHLFVKHPYIFSTHTLRSADLDSLLLLFIMLTTLSLFNFSRSTSTKRKYFWLIIAGIFTGFGFLTKGPMSLIPVVIFFTYQLLNARKVDLKKLLSQFLIVNCTLLIVTVPWHLFMYYKFGNEFIDTYFGYHMLQRGISTLEDHSGNILFYLKLLFRKDFFFSGELLIIMIAYYTIRWLKSNKLMRLKAAFYKLNPCCWFNGPLVLRSLDEEGCLEPKKQKLMRLKAAFYKLHAKMLKSYSLFFCLAASLFSFMLISISQTKLSWYLFPAYPFMLLLMGKFFSDLCKMKNKYMRYIGVVVFLLVLTIQLSVNLHLIVESSLPTGY
jgi:4-amino-4-deoxy-L-arabinose transferase-like glycosyltransferase